MFGLNARRANELAEHRSRNARSAEELRKEVARLIGLRLPVPAEQKLESAA